MQLLGITSEQTPEQLAAIAASLGLNSAKDLQAPPRKDFKSGMGYRLKVISVEFTSDEYGDKAKMKVAAVDASGNVVAGPRSTIFLTFPWETPSFKFKDIDARVRAQQSFKSLLCVAIPAIRLVKRVEVAGVVSYYDAQSGEKLDAKLVKKAYENEDVNVSLVGREMQNKQDVKAFANLVFYAVYNTYDAKDGTKKSNFQRFSAEPLDKVTYITDPKEMFTYGEDSEENATTAHAADVF